MRTIFFLSPSIHLPCLINTAAVEALHIHKKRKKATQFLWKIQITKLRRNGTSRYFSIDILCSLGFYFRYAFFFLSSSPSLSICPYPVILALLFRPSSLCIPAQTPSNIHVTNSVYNPLSLFPTFISIGFM